MPIDDRNPPAPGSGLPVAPKNDADSPGYELTDVNTGGVVVFLGGLMGFLLVFFLLCFFIGKGLNHGILKDDAAKARLNPYRASTAAAEERRRQQGENLAPNPQIEQQQAQLMTQTFPTPRLDADDSNQQTADLHAREDLLLEHTTYVEPGQFGTPGAVRIPISRAMELIAQRGLPTAPGVADNGQHFFGDRTYAVTRPLTNGFARTSYETDQIEQRAQQVRLGEKPGPAGDRASHAEVRTGNSSKTQGAN